MHTAHNTAYANIDTELNVCIDSDDMLADNAVELILNKWHEVKDKGFAGIIGLDADFNGNIIGKSFPPDMVETTLSGYYAAGGSGDKKLVYRTDIIKAYPPYPVFSGEKYVPKGFAFWRTIKMQYPESFSRLVKDCIHYCSSSQIAGNRHYIQESPRKLLTVLCTPAGWLLTAYIKRMMQ